jgi:hypothetical protein
VIDEMSHFHSFSKGQICRTFVDFAVLKVGQVGEYTVDLVLR